MPATTTLLQRLTEHASQRPDVLAYTFLENGIDESQTLTYGELWRVVRNITAQLRHEFEPGMRALLLYPPGLDFIGAFLACLDSGIVAVPVHTPRSHHHTDRLEGIIADSGAELILTTKQFYRRIHAHVHVPSRSRSVTWHFTDEMNSREGITDAAYFDSDTVAFLQYTSGSTSAPKGVMVTHGNITSNQEMIRRGFRNDAESIIVSWLPHYHDMGLIGGILQPLWVGAKCILMPPNAFLREPFSWLSAITKYRATTSGGPNFAYDLCAEKINDEQKRNLELSSWRMAFNGAEPVREQTIERFYQAFRNSGFSRQSMTPCYGLAEATLYVSSTGTRGSYSSIQAPSTSFVQDTESSRSGSVLVSSGPVDDSLIVKIMDPDTHKIVPPGSIGEILLSGPSIALGYWNNAQATSETFGNSVEGHRETFLRTGDLGFQIDRDLVITGRLKDLIIINGRNFHAEDIEHAATEIHPGLRSLPAAAFSIEGVDRPSTVFVQELPRRHDAFEPLDGLAQRIRSAVAEKTELVLDEIVLVRPGAIPRTTSGKVKRRACRDLYLSGGLQILHRTTSSGNPQANAMRSDARQHSSDSGAVQEVLQEAASLLGLAHDEMSADSSLLSLGFDSLMVVNLQHVLESKLGLHIALEDMLSNAPLRDLVLLSTEKAVSTDDPVPLSTEPPGLYSLSPGQRALLYVQLLSPESPSYNLFSASRSKTPLNASIIAQAFQALTERHPILRSVFVNTSEGPMRSVLPLDTVVCDCISASDWDERQLRDFLFKEANRPFDLMQRPPFRVEIIRQAQRGDVLLIVMHHIIADLWSAAILLDELATIYSALVDGETSSRIPAAPVPYSAYVQRQLTSLASGATFDRQKNYWTQYLRDAEPLLALPVDHTPETPSHGAGTLWFELDEDLTRKIKQNAAAIDVSLYSFLLGSFEALLMRITAQDDILVGSPFSGRHSASDARTVGYFANEIVFRARWDPDQQFDVFVRTVHTDVALALDNQDYPFSALVEALGIKRQANRTPLTQVLFGFQNTAHMLGHEMADFALGREGARFRKGILELEAIPISSAGAQTELTLFMAEASSRLFGVIRYDSDRFEQSSAERIASEFLVLLRSVGEDPTRLMRDLPILSPQTERQLLVELNNTESVYAPYTSVFRQIAVHAAGSPNKRAISAYDAEISYGQLINKADSIATLLRNVRVGEGSVVALCCSRSAALPISIVGILRSGAAFLPIDPTMPDERLRHMLEEAGVRVALVDREEHRAKLETFGIPDIVHIDVDAVAPQGIAAFPDTADQTQHPDSLAYVIFTSGSTGTPKGVMVTRRNLANFFHAMDTKLECGPDDRFYALTNITFDISILELLWPLTRGAEVALIPERGRRGNSLLSLGKRTRSAIDFSLFYFADAPDASRSEPYSLLLRGARFADENDFLAVWTPERHFHRFGGLYPNPSVTSAALAALTRNIRIRAGSIVLPLHHPVRVAEEWSVVDNLSHGRVDVAFASGWHADDFSLAPECFHDRREIMTQRIETVRELWRGQTVTVRNGNDQATEIALFPKPVQQDLPIWITASGSPATFELAGSLGFNVLTHLLGQSLEDVKRNIAIYRESRGKAGFNPEQGLVTLMLHTYLGQDLDEVTGVVREPFKQYLRSSVGLIERFIQTMGLPADISQLTEQDMDALLEHAAQRYSGTAALFGTVDGCEPLIHKLVGMGVNEVACLIDFGIEPNLALKSLVHIRELMHRFSRNTATNGARLERVEPRRTLLQCTPSMMKLLLAEEDDQSPLNTLDTLLLGGESLPSTLVTKIQQKYDCAIVNMYGPTETTIWSTIQPLERDASRITAGRPIANTQCYVLDRRGLPVDFGMVGELYIGGDGVAKGYIGRPDLTAERFIANPFVQDINARLYRTGDLARISNDGTIEILGRADLQVKVRGHRVEPTEVESVLARHPNVLDVVVVKPSDTSDDALVAYFVPSRESAPKAEDLRSFATASLPPYMVPSRFMSVEALPLLSSGKVDRKNLQNRPIESRENPSISPAARAQNPHELFLQDLWKRVLRTDAVGLDDNFFDLGGHSLLMVQVHNELVTHLGRSIPLVQLLENPSVRSLAAALVGQDSPSDHQGEAERAGSQRRGIDSLRKNARAAMAAEA